MQSLRLRINSRTQGPIKLHPSKMHNYCKSCFTSQKCAVPANWTIQGRKMQTYVWCRATCNLQLATCHLQLARCCIVLRLCLVYIYFTCAPRLQIASAPCPYLILILCLVYMLLLLLFYIYIAGAPCLQIAAAPCLHIDATHKFMHSPDHS